MKDNLMREIESFLNDDTGLKLSGFGCRPERCAVRYKFLKLLRVEHTFQLT